MLTIAEELIPAPASIGEVATGFPKDEFAEQTKALALARQSSEQTARRRLASFGNRQGTGTEKFALP